MVNPFRKRSDTDEQIDMMETQTRLNADRLRKARNELMKVLDELEQKEQKRERSNDG
jgi:hypothetical protein